MDLCDLLIFALRLQLRTHVRSMSFASKGGLGSEMKSPLEIPAVILAKMDHALKAQQSTPASMQSDFTVPLVFCS